VFGRSHFATRPFQSNRCGKRFGLKHTIGVVDNCLIRQNPIGLPSRDLVETRCRLQLAFGGVTQAFDPIMGRFDLGELTGNKLLG
jgi:hypothetical protein